VSPLSASALVAAGGAIGALMRFWLAVGLNALVGAQLPFATFAANVSGSFLIGLVTILLAAKPALAVLTMTGVLGGFTTFSAFSLETVRLVEEGRAATALGYAGVSVVTCVVAAAAGMALGRAAA